MNESSYYMNESSYCMNECCYYMNALFHWRLRYFVEDCAVSFDHVLFHLIMCHFIASISRFILSVSHVTLFKIE